jgi:hypothetical protein
MTAGRGRAILSAVQQAHEGVAQKDPRLSGRAHTLAFDPVLDLAENLMGRRDARVGSDEQLFELFPKGVVDLAAFEDAGEMREPGPTGTLDGVFGLRL